MNVRDLLSYARPMRGSLLVMTLLACASSGLTLAIPWIAARMLGSIVTGSAKASTGLLAMMLAVLLATAAVNFSVAFQAASTDARLGADLRQRLYEHLQRLPMSFHDNSFGGDTLALMTYEIARLTTFLTGTLVWIPSRLLTTAGAIYLMFRLDRELAVVVPAVIPIFYLVLKIVGRKLRGLAMAVQQAEARVVAAAEEMLEILPAIKAFTREELEAERFRTVIRRASHLAIRLGRVHAGMEPMISFIAGCAAIVMLILAGHSIHSGQISVTQLFSVLFYAALLTRPIGALADVYGRVQSATGTLDRLHSVLSRTPEGATGPSESHWRAKGHVQMFDVAFSYPGRQQTLCALNLELFPGEIVALVGANGAGKSAIINLLMRYYTPQRGSISIDGLDIERVATRDVRRQIGLVPQLPMLFNGTIRENIAFGADQASAAMIEDAARLAQANEFISALPDGIDTMIGDRGVRLSGGQRQRIALARALVKDPPILILDEATSMFDDEGESAFVAASSEALAGRTVLLVAHRPATLSLATRIIVLHNGAVSDDVARLSRLR